MVIHVYQMYTCYIFESMGIGRHNFEDMLEIPNHDGKQFSCLNANTCYKCIMSYRVHDDIAS